MRRLKTITAYINYRPNTNFEWRALWLYYEILTVEAFQLKENNPQRKEKETLLRSLQNILIHSPLLTSKELLELADSALAFERPDLADLIYQKSICKVKINQWLSMPRQEKLLYMLRTIREVRITFLWR